MRTTATTIRAQPTSRAAGTTSTTRRRSQTPRRSGLSAQWRRSFSNSKTQLNQLIGNAAYQQSHYQRQEAGWTNGRMQALPGVPKRAEGTVLGINNRGQIIGDVQKIGPVLWTPKTG